MSKYIFYHIYCCNSSYDIVNDQVKKILFSGLYNKIDSIYCFLAGEETYIDEIIEFISKSGKKFKISKIGVNDQSFERFTIHKIKNYILPEDKFLYIHTKGVTRNNSKSVEDWRTYMEYFLMCKHDKCLELLDVYDTVGVNLIQGVMHYAGNFWWSRGSYFLRLPNINELMTESDNKNKKPIHDIYDQSKYSYTENYLCMRNPNAYCLFISNCQHYDVRYFPENYIDTEI